MREIESIDDKKAKYLELKLKKGTSLGNTLQWLRIEFFPKDSAKSQNSQFTEKWANSLCGDVADKRPGRDKLVSHLNALKAAQ